MKEPKKIDNYAFIDGQNLYLGARENNWQVDYKKLRVYLRDKYKVQNAYYFFGYRIHSQIDMYTRLQEDGYIVVFKEHTDDMHTKKKGNIDTDLVFCIMQKLIERPQAFSKIVLISGDGDFKKMIDYLIRKERFAKIIFPNKRYRSSLYRSLNPKYYDYLASVKDRIAYKKGVSPKAPTLFGSTPS